MPTAQTMVHSKLLLVRCAFGFVSGVLPPAWCGDGRDAGGDFVVLPGCVCTAVVAEVRGSVVPPLLQSPPMAPFVILVASNVVSITHWSAIVDM